MAATPWKAIAAESGKVTSAVTSHTYVVPAGYDAPAAIPAGRVTVDGNLSDWADGVWTALNQNYDSQAGDIQDGAFAVKWSVDKIYVAVKLRDTAQKFTDNYTDWNARDAVEFYLYTTGSGPDNFPDCETAQQYTVGFTTGGTDLWAALGNSSMYPRFLPTMFPIPSDAEYFTARGHKDGEWLYYEAAITPFEFLGVVNGKPSIESPLTLNDIVGVDVCVVGHDGSNYTGMKSANLKTGKSGNLAQIGVHKLAPAVIAGDANRDGKVDVSDLGILAANYGASSGATWMTGDFNGDGKVDVSDLGILAANYGSGSGAALDFSADAAALGLSADAKVETPAGSTLGCGSAGLPLVAGLLLLGVFLTKLEE